MFKANDIKPATSRVVVKSAAAGASAAASVTGAPPAVGWFWDGRRV